MSILYKDFKIYRVKEKKETDNVTLMCRDGNKNKKKNKVIME